MHQEVAAQFVWFRVFRAMGWMLGLGDRMRKQDHWRRSGLDFERLCRANTAHVDSFVGEAPTLGVRMEVVPHHAEVEVEDIPADLLAGVRDDCRRITNEGPAVEAETGQSSAVFGDGMLRHVARGPRWVIPVHLSAGLDCDCGGV